MDPRTHGRDAHATRKGTGPTNTCRFFLATLLAVLAASGLNCRHASPPAKPSVVIFTSLDEVFSEPILREFGRQSGIEVKPVYDAESSKTTGLVNRLISRKDQPECDVLWNNEYLQTQRMAQMGLLEPYVSPNARRIPARFRDAAGRWTGFAARARVLIYNTSLVKSQDAPGRMADLADPRWRGKAALARPFFGTTLTHMAALYQCWGPERLGDYAQALRDNDVALCPGNASVRDLVASGERAIGVTDTDDAYEALCGHKAVAVCVPDPDQGLLLIPNTVAVIARCPHPDAARKLVDYLLSVEVERALAQGPGAQIPLGEDLADLKTPWQGILAGKRMEFDPVQAAEAIPQVVQLLQQKGMDR